MLFPWKKNARTKVGSENASQTKLQLSERLRSPTENKCIISLSNVDLAPSFQGLNCKIHQGTWLLLVGPDDFAKALFCDLCFSFISPEAGEVFPRLEKSDVSFLGRSNTTYGHALIDHLYSGVREHSKELVVHVIENVFSKTLKARLSKNNPLEFTNNKNLAEMELSEKDLFEIAEANALLQNRAAAIVDTTTDFYRVALEQGFKHSKLLLDSGKTIFWIIDEKQPLPLENAPWHSYPNKKKSSLYFVSEDQVNHIN